MAIQQSGVTGAHEKILDSDDPKMQWTVSHSRPTPPKHFMKIHRQACKYSSLVKRQTDR